MLGNGAGVGLGIDAEREKFGDCPYEWVCWHFSYSLYQKKKGFSDPKVAPTRHDLLTDGFATHDMMPDSLTYTGRVRCKGVFASNLPTTDKKTWCASLKGECHKTCFDFREMQKREEQQAEFKENAERRRQRKAGNYLKRGRLTKQQKRDICSRQGWKCYWCDRHRFYFVKLGYRLVFDHVIPLARGGDNELNNFVMACSDCNTRKGTEIWTKNQRKNQV